MTVSSLPGYTQGGPGALWLCVWTCGEAEGSGPGSRAAGALPGWPGLLGLRALSCLCPFPIILVAQSPDGCVLGLFPTRHPGWAGLL